MFKVPLLLTFLFLLACSFTDEPNRNNPFDPVTTSNPVLEILLQEITDSTATSADTLYFKLFSLHDQVPIEQYKYQIIKNNELSIPWDSIPSWIAITDTLITIPIGNLELNNEYTLMVLPGQLSPAANLLTVIENHSFTFRIFPTSPAIFLTPRDIICGDTAVPVTIMANGLDTSSSIGLRISYSNLRLQSNLIDSISDTLQNRATSYGVEPLTIIDLQDTVSEQFDLQWLFSYTRQDSRESHDISNMLSGQIPLMTFSVTCETSFRDTTRISFDTRYTKIYDHNLKRIPVKIYSGFIHK